MAVSTADFYAYAQATGTEVPSSKKEQAKIAPAVHQWRRSQIKQKRQENQPDLGDVVAWTGLGTGALAAAFLRDPSRARQVRDKVGKLKQGYNELRNNIADKIAADPSSGIDTSATIDTSAQVTPKENVQTLIDKVQPSTQVEAVSQKQPILEKLKAQGIPEFEANARMQAYADSNGDTKFLDPTFNANTLPSGLEGFRQALGVQNIRVNNKNQIIFGQRINPTSEVPASLPDYARHTSEDYFDSDLAASGLGQEGMAVTKSLPTTGAGVSARDPQAFLKAETSARKPQTRMGEQYRLANEEFARQWDVLAQDGQVQPRMINRVVEPDELNLVVRNEVLNKSNEVVSPAVTYGELLQKTDPDSFNQLSQGKSVQLDVPYQVNKAKDLNTVLLNAYEIPGNRASKIINPNLIDEWQDKYTASGERLLFLHKHVFGGITGDDAIVNIGATDLSSGTKLLTPLDGEVITPAKGAGSQKGKQAGGMVRPYVSEPIYNLTLETVKYGPNNSKTRDRVMAQYKQPDESFIGRERSLIDSLSDDLIVGKTGENFEEIVSQPVELTKILQNEKIGTLGNKQDVYYTTSEVVQAPLQVQKLNPLSGEVVEEVQGKINRLDIQSTLRQIQDQARTENAAASVVRSKVPKGGLPRKELSNLIAQTSKRTGINPNLIVQRLRTGGEADTSYKGLAAQLQNRLIAEKGIRLPVLDSRQAYNFIDNILGYPRDKQAQKRAMIIDTRGPVTKTIPVTTPQQLKKLDIKSATTLDPNLSTVPMGQPSENIIDVPKKATSSYDVQYERVGWGDDDVIKVYDSNDFLTNYMGQTELGQATLNPPGLQTNIKIDKTGTSGEMRKIRNQLSKMSNQRDLRFNESSQPVRTNILANDQWIQEGSNPTIDKATGLSILEDIRSPEVQLSESTYADAQALAQQALRRQQRRRGRN